jgi:hypothetical protein
MYKILESDGVKLILLVLIALVIILLGEVTVFTLASNYSFTNRVVTQMDSTWKGNLFR